MRSLPARYEPAAVEADSAAFWRSRSLPRDRAATASGAGPPFHQIVSALAAADTSLSFLQRAIRADAEARFQLLEGHASNARLVARRGDHPALEGLAGSLVANGVWVGGGRIDLLVGSAGPAHLQSLLDRLASEGLIRSREAPLRSCPACRAPRSPEGIVYAAEDGDAYLVRFLLDGPSPRTSLLVWIDSAWKLLGTSAVLVHPDLPYVRVRYRRRGNEEAVYVLRSAVDRLRSWLDGCEIEVLEEKRGSDLVGLRYEHPLSVEFPTLAALPAPAGQVAASGDVDDSGTGVVALVPAHGAGDAAAANQLGIPGWPVVGPDGLLVRDLQHKYSGLPVEVAEAFVLRDLGEAGLLFAQLRVHRGVPHCAVCGSPLFWQPSRAWCLEMASVSPAVRERLARIAALESLPRNEDPVPWPVSEWRTTEAADAPKLLECVQCGRLAPIATGGERCSCGANWRVVARRLLPSLEEPLTTWGLDRPFPGGDPVRLFVPDRRRGPTVALHAVAAFAADAAPGDVRTISLPTLPADAETDATAPTGPADALRGAILRTAASPRAGDPTLTDRRRQEERRLRKVWQVVRVAIDRSVAEGYDYDPRPISARLAELFEEDRAFLSLFERMRADVIRSYESGSFDRAQDRLIRFFEDELRGAYLPLVRSRLAEPGPSPGKIAAFRVLGHVLPLWAELYSPIAPFTMEAIHRAFRGDGSSLFERTIAPSQELLLDAAREQSYAKWRSIVAALREYRAELGLAADARLPSIVLSVADDAAAIPLRAEHEVLERLALVDRVEVASPSHPWAGRQVRVRPVAEELQRVYPFQSQRMLRMLEGMAPARIQEGIRAGTLQLVLEGHPLPITASMIEVTEGIPEGIVPISWTDGELFVTLPSDLPGRGEAAPPPLTPDGFRLLRAARRRIARSPTPSAVDRISIAASGALAADLAKHSAAISAYLQGIELVLADGSGGFRSDETTIGRTRRGEKWSLWIPGAEVAASRKHRTPQLRRPRLRGTGRPVGADHVPDFLDDELRARETAIRDAVESFDHALGRPLIGPAKLALAWEGGLTSFEAVAHAPYERLSEVPGFGPVLAEAVVVGFGGTVPPRPVRAALRAPDPVVTVVAPPIGPRSDSPRSEGTAVPPHPSAIVDPPSVALPPPAAAPASTILEPDSPAVAPSVPTSPPPVSLPPPPIAVAVTVVPPPPSPPPAPRAPPPTAGEIPHVEPPAPPSTPPPPNGVEVWAAPTADRPWTTFLELTEGGAAGLCLSREFPERLRTHVGSRNVRIIWLSNVGREGSVRPGDLDGLRALFRGFLGGGPGRSAYFEGVEYLVRIHGTARTLEFLRELHALAGETGARLLLPVNPALLDPDAAERLRVEFPAGV